MIWCILHPLILYMIVFQDITVQIRVCWFPIINYQEKLFYLNWILLEEHDIPNCRKQLVDWPSMHTSVKFECPPKVSKNWVPKIHARANSIWSRNCSLESYTVVHVLIALRFAIKGKRLRVQSINITSNSQARIAGFSNRTEIRDSGRTSICDSIVSTSQIRATQRARKDIAIHTRGCSALNRNRGRGHN